MFLTADFRLGSQPAHVRVAPVTSDEPANIPLEDSRTKTIITSMQWKVIVCATYEPLTSSTDGYVAGTLSPRNDMGYA